MAALSREVPELLEETVLLVDDDAALLEVMTIVLSSEGYRVITASDGAEALREIGRNGLGLVVLDVMLPRISGFEVLRQIREKSDVPVVMLTAKSQSVDKVVGLELGADDYIPKPCELRELVARIRSVLRRGTAPAAATAAAAPADAPTNAVRVGTKWFDFDTHRLRDDAGQEQILTRSEYALLRAFTDNPKRVLSRDRLLDLADARDPDAFDRSIDVRINRIRKKIEPEPAHPRYIRTVRGLGYVFRPEGD